MQRRVAEAVLGTLHETPQGGQREALAALTEAAWKESFRWLDASGLALYFLDQVQRLRWESALPESVLARLEQNLEDNRARTADLFAEFARINRGLMDAGICFVNVKGMTLVPDACPDAALRHQLDLDFVARREDADRCAEVLAGAGYRVTAKSGEGWEFKAGSSTVPSIRDLYKPKPQRSAEVHFAEEEDERLTQREWRELRGFVFPALSASDGFLLQAGHLLKHLGGEWTRVSWLLEFRNAVIRRREDAAFWSEVRAKADAQMRTAIGAGIALATQAFGAFAPEDLARWAMGSMDSRLQLWLERYGREVLLADFPGTKLYLLLPPMTSSAEIAARERRKRLLPLHCPPQVAFAGEGERVWTRLVRWRTQMGYAWFRLRFHVTEGARYLREAERWKRIAGPAQ